MAGEIVPLRRRPSAVGRAPRGRQGARSSRACRCPGWSSGPAPSRPTSTVASGAHFRCVDGHDYVDFCLGDTGAMAGHGPAATMAAVERQMRRGITHMLPTEDAAWVGEELTRRFGVGAWQFALSASDANRWALRLARHITGRSKVVVHDHCYHGSVDEAIAMLGPDGVGRAGAGLGRAAGRRRRDDPGRRVQRHRRARGGARRWRRRRRAVRARADQRRDRPARAGLSRRRPRAHPPHRHAADHRRDPHHLRRPGRRDRRLAARARHRWSSARPSAAGSRRRPTASAPRSPSGSPARSRSTTPTSAGSAGRWQATRCRSRPSGRPSARS